MPYKYDHTADNAATQARFECDMPDIMSRLLSGVSSAAGCGVHFLQVRDDGILISRGTAEFIMRNFTKASHERI